MCVGERRPPNMVKSAILTTYQEDRGNYGSIFAWALHVACSLPSDDVVSFSQGWNIWPLSPVALSLKKHDHGAVQLWTR